MPTLLSSDDDVVIIGGSLSGLTFALACANRGICTRVLEQYDGTRRSGAALGVDRSALLRTVSLNTRDDGKSASFPTLTTYRQAVAWRDLHDWLQNQALGRSEITLVNGVTILEVVQRGECATAITSEGQRVDAPIIIGADGYRSIVRQAISPEQPTPLFAGYLLWRGLVNETDLPATAAWPSGNSGNALFSTAGGYRLVAYPVAGPEGSLKPGRRLVSFTWYDSTRNSLLRELGRLSPAGKVVSSLAAEDVPLWICSELRDEARKIWPEPWRSIIVHALEQRDVFATPVVEYFPKRLRRGRLAIIGDAAHVVAPREGQGFTAGIVDADVLADCLASGHGQSPGGVSSALASYEDRRLQAAQQLVSASMKWSREFVRRQNEK